jgi:glycosyltransferase involved in cell wall biosynthesis
MEWFVYRRADLIVVPSKNHASYLEEKRFVPKVKLRFIPHWINTAFFDTRCPTGKFRKMWELEGKFVFLFAGVLGPSQRLDIVLDVAEEFQKEKKMM